MLAIMRGKRPPRPHDPAFTDDLWELTQDCWNQDPRLRPEISEVLQTLHGLLAPSTTTYYRRLRRPNQYPPLPAPLPPLPPPRRPVPKPWSFPSLPSPPSPPFAPTHRPAPAPSSPTSDPHSQAWKLLISCQFATHERASLITTALSGYGETEILRRLSVRDDGDVQTFVDVIDEASLQTPCAGRRMG